MVDINIDIPAGSEEAKRLVEAAEKHDSLTRDPPQCPRCGRVLTRWKTDRADRIKRAECNGCGWYR